MGKITNSGKNTIAIEEQILLDNYRVLDDRGKQELQLTAYLHLERICNEYLASQKERQQPDEAKQNSNIIHFRAPTV